MLLRAMDTRRIDDALAQTLEDSRLSRAERKALSELIPELAQSDNDHDVIRARAFELARRKLSEPGSHSILGWLEDVVRLLRPQSTEPALKGEVYFSPGRACVSKIISLLGNARQTVDICVFTITDDRISRAIVDAHLRGSTVRVITDDAKAFDRGSDVDRLEEAGVPVTVDHSPAHMHHKYAVFDRRLVATGSFNWTRSATDENHENLLVVEGLDVVRRYGEEFDRLWDDLRNTRSRA